MSRVEIMPNVLIIAEIGQAHEGSLGILHSLIDAVAQTGADVMKFQTHIAAAESSIYEPFRVKFSYVDQTRFDYWKRMEFSLEQWKGIKRHCDEVGLEFLSSPFSNAAVELLERLGVRRYKVGSGEVNNFLMLEKIARTGKDIFLSSGMSSFAELDSTVEFLRPFGNTLSILQCTTKYPTTSEDVGLNVIPALQERYNVPIGFSDHSGTIYPAIAAVALGAEIIEVHATFDQRMFGPDARASVSIDQLRQLVEGVRFIENSRRNPVDKHDVSAFRDVKTVFEKSLAVNKDLPSGHTLRVEDLESKKPAGYGFSATDYQKIVGKTLARPKKQYEFLGEADIEHGKE